MAQTYKFGKDGQWATKKGSTLAYSDTNNAFKPLPFSFERNSIATRVNKEGLIEVVGNDIPRIDYTDSTEGALLLENSSTNLITQSEDFSNSAWSKSNSTITNDNAISPNGTLNADKLVENAVSSTHWIREVVSVSNGKVTFSIFAKKGERNFLVIRENTLGGKFFDLSNGTINSDFNATLVDDAKIESYGNGWYKCSITVTVSTSSADFLIYVTNEDGVTNYQGDGASGIYIWGAMLEANSVASSYIPTNGSTVQRAAETCNESGNSEVFNDSQGVLFADVAALSNDGTNRQITLSDGTTSNRVYFTYSTVSNQFSASIISSGSLSFNTNYTSTDLTNYHKILIKYKQNDFSLWVNGFKIATDTIGNTPSGLKNINLSSSTSSLPFYGNTKEIAYYDEILTDAELETLTSYRSLNEMVTELNLNAL